MTCTRTRPFLTPPNPGNPHTARGKPIGSGLIEWASKQMIGRRMKQTVACWTVANANRMDELCRLTCSDPWNANRVAC